MGRKSVVVVSIPTDVSSWYNSVAELRSDGKMSSYNLNFFKNILFHLNLC